MTKIIWVIYVNNHEGCYKVDAIEEGELLKMYAGFTSLYCYTEHGEDFKNKIKQLNGNGYEKV